MPQKADWGPVVFFAVLLGLLAWLPWAVVKAYKFFGWSGFLWTTGAALAVGFAFWVLSRLIGENGLEACLPAYVMCGLIFMAAPKFAELSYRSAEGTAKGHLDRLRSEAERGRWPGEWPAIAAPPFHPKSSARLLSATPDDAGGWQVTPSSLVYVNCTHTDVRGRVWHSY